MIVFEGDFVRRGDEWFEVVDIGASDMVKLSDGNWALACETEMDDCLLYTSPSPRDRTRSRMPSSA